MTSSDERAADAYNRFRAGDKDAFTEIVALYRRGLAGYINCFAVDAHEADDLAVDAFAELAAGLNFKGGSTLKTYLFAIGRRLALRYVKSYKGTTRVAIDAIADVISVDESDPESAYLLKERKESLYAAMEALKPEYREVLYLIYLEGMSYAEAGVTMRKSVSQITNLAHRAKASLKKKLIAGGDTP